MSLRSLLTNLIHLCWIQLFVCSVLLKARSALHQHNHRSTSQTKHTWWSVPSPDKALFSTAQMKAYTITESTFAAGHNEKAPSISRKCHSFDLNHFTFCQMLLGKSNLQEGRSEIWAKFCISLIQWSLGNGLCVCASGHAWESNIFFGFKKAFNLTEWAQSFLDVPGSQNKL